VLFSRIKKKEKERKRKTKEGKEEETKDGLWTLRFSHF
jgi:hypothetical protein